MSCTWGSEKFSVLGFIVSSRTPYPHPRARTVPSAAAQSRSRPHDRRAPVLKNDAAERAPKMLPSR